MSAKDLVGEARRRCPAVGVQKIGRIVIVKYTAVEGAVNSLLNACRAVVCFVFNQYYSHR